MEYGDGSEIEVTGQPDDGVVLKLYGDDSDVMRRLDLIENRAALIQSKLQLPVDKQTLHIGVEVGTAHDVLAKLNRHIEDKRTHVQDVNRWMAANPLQPRIDTSQIEPGIRRVKKRLSGDIGVKSDRQSARYSYTPEVSSQKPANIDFEPLIDEVKRLNRAFQRLNKSIEDLPGLTADAIEKSQKPGLLSRVGSLVTAPIRAAGSIAGFGIQEIFRGFLLDAGMGLGQGVGLSRFTKSSAKKAAEYGNRISSEIIGLEDYLSTFLGELITSGSFQKATNAAGGKLKIGKYLESLGKLALLSSTPQNENYLDNIRRADPDLFSKIDEKLEGRLSRGEKIGVSTRSNAVKAVAKDLSASADGLISDVVMPTIEDLATPLRFISKIQTYRTAQKAKKEADRINALFPLLKDGEEGIVNVIGGAQFREGEGGRMLQAAFEGILPNRRLFSVQNPDTDPAGKAQGYIENFILNQVRTLAPDAFKTEDFKNTLINAVQLVASAIDPNFISTAAVQAVANSLVANARGIKPEDISTLTYSLGGAEGIRTAAALQEAGLPQAQVLAMSYPFLDIAKLNLPNFQSTLLKNDPLNFAYDLGLTVPDRQKRFDGGKVQGFEAHAYKHLFKVPEFLELFYQKMGQAVPSNPKVLQKAADTISSYLHGASGLYELIGSITQAQSLLSTGNFDLKAPYKSFIPGEKVSGIDVITKLAESAADVGRFAGIKPANGVSAEVIAISREIPKIVQPLIKELANQLRSSGASLPNNASAEDIYGYLKLQSEAPKLNESIRVFQSGDIPDKTEAYFAGELNPEIINQRMRDFDLAITYFKKAPLGQYKDQIIGAFESLKAVAKEYADTGKLSNETRSKLKEINIENLTGDFAQILNQTFNPQDLKGFEDLRRFQFDAPKWAYDLPQSVLAYNKMAESLKQAGLAIPEINEFERAAYGMSGAAALLTDKLVYKTDINDPQKISSEQEVKAYDRLAGRYAPQLYKAAPGEFLITERIHGAPVKDRLDELANPAKLLNKERKELAQQLTKLTTEFPVLRQSTQGIVDAHRRLRRAIAQGNDQAKQDAQSELQQLKSGLIAQVGSSKVDEFTEILSRRSEVLAKYREARRIFNQEAADIYQQVGRLGKTLQEMGVAHNDLASANVFMTPEGLKAIDLGNAIVDPTNQQKNADQITTIQRALIDRSYWGLLDPVRMIGAIRSGYSGEAFAPVSSIPPNPGLLTPRTPGSAVPLGSQQGKFLDAALGGYTSGVEEIRQEISRKKETSIQEAPAPNGEISESKQASGQLAKLGDAARDATNALTLLTHKIFPVSQQGSAAIVRQGLSDINRFGIRPAVQTVGSLIKTADTVTDLLPFGVEIKGVTKNVVIPAATIGMLSQTPIAGQALETVGQLGSHALSFAPDMLAANAPGWAYGAIDKLLQISGAGGVEGAAAATGSALAQYGAYQYLARQGKSFVDVTYERIANHQQATIPEQQSKKILAGESSSLMLPFAGDPARLARLTQEVRQAYSAIAKPKLLGQETEVLVRNIEKYLYVLRQARAEAQKIPNESVGKFEKAQLSRSRSDAEKGAISELARRIGQDMEGGLDAGIDLSNIRELAQEIGLTLTDEVKRVLGIASPSKVFIKIGKDVVAGFELGLEDLDNLENRIQEFFDVANKSGLKLNPVDFGGIDKIAKDIREGTANGTRDFQKNFTTLEDQGRKTASGFKGFLNNVKNFSRSVASEAYSTADDFISFDRLAGRAKGFADELRPIQGISRSIGDEWNRLKESFPVLGRASGLIKEIAAGAALGLGIFSIGDALVALGRQGFQTALDLERTKIALDFTNAGQGAAVLDEVRQQADRLGTSFLGAAEARKQLDNATTGTVLQGSSPILAELQQQLLAPRGLDIEQQRRFSLATAQIAAKGRFQAEELLQYAEAGLPAQVALADALGISQLQLPKRLESGDISAQKALPLLFTQLAAESQAKQEKLSQTAPAKLNRFGNESQRAVLQLGQAFGVVAIPVIEKATEALRLFNDNLDKVGNLAAIAGVLLVGKLISPIGNLMLSISGWKSLIGSTLNLAIPLFGKLASIIGTLAVPTAIAAGIVGIGAAAIGYYDKIIKGNDELISSNRRVEDSITRIQELYKNAPAPRRQPGLPQQPTTGNGALDFLDSAGNAIRGAMPRIAALPSYVFSGFNSQVFEPASDALDRSNLSKIRPFGRGAFETESRQLNEGGSRGYSAIRQAREVMGTPEFEADVSRRQQFQFQIDQLSTQRELAERAGNLDEIKRLQREIDRATSDQLRGSESGKLQTELRIQREEAQGRINVAQSAIDRGLGGSDLILRQRQIADDRNQIKLIDQELDAISRRIKATPQNLKVQVEVQAVGIEQMQSAVEKAAAELDMQVAQQELRARRTPGVDLQKADSELQIKRNEFTIKRITAQQKQISELANRSRGIVASLPEVERQTLDEVIGTIEAGATLETASSPTLSKVAETIQTLSESQKQAIAAQLQVKDLGKQYTALATEQARTGIELDKLLRDRRNQIIDQNRMIDDIPLLQADRLLAGYRTESEITQQILQARQSANDAMATALQSRQSLNRSRLDFNIGGIDQMSQLLGTTSQGATPITASANRFTEIELERTKVFERSEGLEADQRSLQEIQAAQADSLKLKRESLIQSQEQNAIDLAGQRISALRTVNEAKAALAKAKVNGLSKAEIETLQEQLTTANDAVSLIDRRIQSLKSINQLQMQGLNYEEQSLENQQAQERISQQQQARELSYQSKILDLRQQQAQLDLAASQVGLQGQQQQIQGSIAQAQTQLELGRAERTGRSDAPELRQRLLDQQQEVERSSLESEIRQQQIANSKNLIGAQAAQQSAQEAVAEALKNNASKERLESLRRILDSANQALEIAEAENKAQTRLNAGKREELRLRQQIAQEAQNRASFDLTSFGDFRSSQSKVQNALQQNVVDEGFGQRTLKLDVNAIERLASVASLDKSAAIDSEIGNLGLDAGLIRQLSELDMFQRRSFLDRASLQANYDGTNIVQAINGLRNELKSLVMRPTTLNVSSPNPIMDAASIYRELGR